MVYMNPNNLAAKDLNLIHHALYMQYSKYIDADNHYSDFINAKLAEDYKELLKIFPYVNERDNNHVE